MKHVSAERTISSIVVATSLVMYEIRDSETKNEDVIALVGAPLRLFCLIIAAVSSTIPVFFVSIRVRHHDQLIGSSCWL